MDNKPIILSDGDITKLKDKHGVILFYMDGCNPCNMIKPHWNKAIEELKSEVGEEIILGAIERGKLDSFNKHINVNHHVNGFPTILYLHPSNHSSPEVYNGKRTHEDIRGWIMEKKNRSTGAKKHMEKKRSNVTGYQGGGAVGSSRRRRMRRSRRRGSKRHSGSRMPKRRKSMRRSRRTKRRQSGGGCGCGSGSGKGGLFDFLRKPKQLQQQQQQQQ
jgi:hypothetical protein